MDNLDEATGTSVAETATDSTPEPNVPDTAAEEAEAVETPDEAVETDETDAAATTDEPTESAEPDPFSDLERPQFETEEEIKKHRIPKEVKTRYLQTAQIARELTTFVESSGGKEALTAVAPMAIALTQPFASQAQLDAAIDGLANGNATVGGQFLLGSVKSLFEDAPEYANNFLTEHFKSEKATVETLAATAKLLDEYGADTEKLAELLRLDKAGLLDTEYARSEFQTNFAETNLYNEMRAKQAEADKRIAELNDLLSNPDKLARQQAKNSPDTARTVSEFDADFRSAVKSSVTDIVSRVNWTPEGKLAETVAAVVAAQLANSEQYGNVRDYISQTGLYKNGDKPVLVAQTNLHLLTNRAKALTLEIVKGIQSDMKAVMENSRNAAVARKQAESAPATVAKTLPANNTETFAEKQERLRREFKERIRAEERAQAAGQV